MAIRVGCLWIATRNAANTSRGKVRVAWVSRVFAEGAMTVQLDSLQLMERAQIVQILQELYRHIFEAIPHIE